MSLMLFNLWARLSYFLKDFLLYETLVTLSFFLFIFLTYKVYKSERAQVRKKVYFSLISLFFILILVYSGFEAYFRYGYDQSDGLGFLKVDRKWHERHDRFNNYFYRDRNFEEVKQPGTTRIGVMGDSIAQGSGIKDPNNRFSDILEKKLRDSGQNVEVYNLGRSGYDTDEEVKAYEEVRHLKFNILVWEYFINDIQPAGQSTGDTIIAKNSQKAKVVSFLSDRSYFFDFMYWRFSSRYQKTFQELRTADLSQYKNPEVLTHHQKAISNFIESLNEDNTKVVVVIFPSLFILSNDYPAKDINQMMSDYFQNNGASVIDLLPYVMGKDKNKLMASPFDPHPNEIVHRLAAEKLYEKILPLVTSNQP